MKNRLLLALPTAIALAFVVNASRTRAQAPGDVETGFDPSISGTAVYGFGLQPDGKVIVVGDFGRSIARINSDGTLDGGFNAGADSYVSCVMVQPDEKTIIGGSFKAVNSMPFNSIARLNADGTVDTAFNPDANSSVTSITLQADGKILLSGLFTTIGGVTRNRIARINADGSLDASFNPDANNYVYSVAVQADGKILLGGLFTAVSGTARYNIARLNADGSLDTAFNPSTSDVQGITVQPDGKILICGAFTNVSGTARNYIARLNADGTVDMGFNPNANGRAWGAAVQTDGKIIVGGNFTAVGGVARTYVARLNADGSLDTGFDIAVTGNFTPGVRTVAVQADGRILLGGLFNTVGGMTHRNIARLYNGPATATLLKPDSTRLLWNRNGAEPEVTRVSFELSGDGGVSWSSLGDGTRIGTTADWQRTGLSLPASGSLRVRGRAITGGNNGSSGLTGQLLAFGFEAPEIAVEQPGGAALADGNASIDFGDVPVGLSSAERTFTIENIGTSALTISGVAVNGGNTSDFSVNTARMLSSVPAGGYTSFSVIFSPTFTGSRSTTLQILNDDADESSFEVALTGMARTVKPGDVEAEYNPVVDGAVVATALQPDGKAIIGGIFSSVSGTVRNNIARLNVDGTLDAGFNPNANGFVPCVAVQANGKILIGGSFTAIGGTARKGIARLNADGTLDAAFNLDLNSTGLFCMAVQADGKILIGGGFTTIGSTTRNQIARLNTDGSLDTGFNPNANSDVNCVAVQSDGRILLGGGFTSVGGSTHFYIARVNANGSVDASFGPSANNVVNSVAMQADGKILVAGQFGTINGTPRGRIARLNPDGTLEPGVDLQVRNGILLSNCSTLAVQTDGKILLGGGFITVGGAVRNRIARLNPDASIDADFNPMASSNVYNVTLQANGRVLLGGNFTSVGTTVRRLARLHNDVATGALSTPDSTQVLWTRGGSAQEVSQVTFELSTNGGSNWSFLGAGTRIDGGWQLTGLNLPASGSLRARIRTPSGQYNGSSGLVDTLTTFGILPPIQSWKQQNLGDLFAPDTSDADGDGIVTLAEYGLVMDPTKSDGAPVASVLDYAEGRRLRMLVPRDPTRNDVTVEVQAAGNLAGPWMTIATSALGAPFSGPGYVGGDDEAPGIKTVEVRDVVNVSETTQRFLRVKVTH